MHGKAVCWTHGGASPAPGPGHPAYKQGRFSKFAPARIASRIQDLEQAPPKDLVDLADDIITIEALLRDALTKLDTGESGQGWTNLKKLYGDFLRSIREHDSALSDKLIREMGDIITSGANEADTRREVTRLVAQSATIRRSYFSMMAEHEMIVTTKQLTLFIAQLAERLAARVLSHPGGMELMNGIQRDISELFSAAFTAPAPGENGRVSAPP